MLDLRRQDACASGLKALGHEVKPAGYLTFGSAQAIIRNPDTGVLTGASDSRRDGLALGW